MTDISGPDELRKWARKLRDGVTQSEAVFVLPVELDFAADAWQLLIDAVNESDEPCLPECDSFAHAEKCPHVDRAAWMVKQQTTIVDLHRRLEAAEKLLRQGQAFMRESRASARWSGEVNAALAGKPDA